MTILLPRRTTAPWMRGALVARTPAGTTLEPNAAEDAADDLWTDAKTGTCAAAALEGSRCLQHQAQTPVSEATA
jgi:hypothetical protein